MNEAIDFSNKEFSQTYNVIAGQEKYLIAAIERINKRSSKKGLPLISFMVGKPFQSEATVKVDGYMKTVEVWRVPFVVTSERVCYSGYEFVASLQHLEGGTLVLQLPDTAPIPELYKHRHMCDHCLVNRQRNQTYIVRHDNGTYKQVGSTCVNDFLNGFPAHNLMSRVEGLAEVNAFAGDCCNYSGQASDCFQLPALLAKVANYIRQPGNGWVSKSAAYKTGAVSTSEKVSSNYRKIKEEACDYELAEKVIAWACDMDVPSDNDYLHNLQVIARGGVVREMTLGLACSMIVAYQNAMAKLARAQVNAASEFVGVIKVRSSFNVVLDYVNGWATQYGYTTLLKFKDERGNVLVWKSSSNPTDQNNNDVGRQEVGKQYVITGSVKDHSVYEGIKQTVLTRCKLVAKG